MSFSRAIRNFLNCFKSSPEKVDMRTEPIAESKILGFNVSMKKKEGILLNVANQNDPDAPKMPAVEDTYYEIQVDATGENPEYPQKTSSFVFTVAASNDMGSGYANGVSFIPAKARFTTFLLAEEFDDGKKTPSMGKRMPPHHMVMLTAHFRNSDDKENYVGIGMAVRKSERESDAWYLAMRCPVTYM